MSPSPWIPGAGACSNAGALLSLATLNVVQFLFVLDGLGCCGGSPVRTWHILCLVASSWLALGLTLAGCRREAFRGPFRSALAIAAVILAALVGILTTGLAMMLRE
jgi:hypothetical protein